MSTYEEINNVYDLVEHIQLVEVRLVRFKAMPDKDAEDSVGMSFNMDVTDGQLTTLFAFRLVSDDYSLETEHAAVWNVDIPLLPDGEAIADFIQKVAFMTVYPYVREALATSACRLGLPAPTLSLVRQGDVDLSLDPDQLGAFLAKNPLSPVGSSV